MTFSPRRRHSEHDHALSVLRWNRGVPAKAKQTCMMLAWGLVVCLMGCSRDDPRSTGPSKADADAVALQVEGRAEPSWEARVREVVLSTADRPDRMVARAMQLGRSGETRAAAEVLRLSVSEHLSAATDAQVQLAVRSLLEVGRLSDAATLLETVLADHPDFHTSRRTLCGLWGELDRPEKAQPHFEFLVRGRRFDLGLLVAHVTEGQRLYAQRTIDTMMQRNPDDRTVLLGRAREAYQNADQTTATKTLREILQKHADFGPAIAMQAMVEAEQDPLAFDGKWFANHADTAGEQPEYWLAMATIAQASGDAAAATDAASRAVAINPRDAKAWSTLLSLMQQTRGAANDSTIERVSRVTQGLLELKKRFFQFNGEARTRQTAVVPIIEALLELGRNWEAEAWAAVASTLPNDPTEQIETLRQQAITRMRSRDVWSESAEFARDLPSRLAVAGSAKRWRAVAARDFVPDKSNATPIDSEDSLRGLAELDRSRFEMRDEATRRGVDFYGNVGNTVVGPHVVLSETVGCGGGAIDFDWDGWPDVVLMAAGGRFGGADSEPNAWFRNHQGTFARVTDATRCVDRHFGQGVLVSDFNEDGWDDVLFLSAGPNTLWLNQGDGTFIERSDQMLGAKDAWSTSAARMDFNGDGWGDLYIANYCEVSPSLAEPCVNTAGETVTCHPLQFAAGRDLVFWGRQDGRYQSAGENDFEWPSAGRGLGVMAGPMIGSRPGVFVANDMSANHFFETRMPPDETSEAIDSDATPRFSDTAVLRGVAVDGRSLTQASMGIAADDLDGDGDLDLHVTGFAREFNLFYEQTVAGLFVDQTRRRGLESETVDVVGFGCQALDIDGDGRREVVVANGHIGDFGNEIPYAQPFQIFTLEDNGRYRVVESSVFGEYFQTPHVGRAVWKSDVDRDGRSDVWVTHATEPVALLMNRSSVASRRTSVRLIGTRANRRPVGATAVLWMTGDGSGQRVEASDQGRAGTTKSQSSFVVSGDGYLCSNDNVLTFELGDAGDSIAGDSTGIDLAAGDRSARASLTVTWPSGREQTVGPIVLGGDYLLIEDASGPFRLD